MVKVDKGKIQKRRFTVLTFASYAFYIVYGGFMIVSAYHLYHDAERFDLPSVIRWLTILILDANMVILFITIMYNKISDRPWKIRAVFATFTALFSGIFNFDYYGEFIPADYGGLLLVSYSFPAFIIMAMFESNNFVQRAKEKNRPVSEQMFDYWYDETVNKGRKVTGAELESKFGVDKRRANELKRSWEHAEKGHDNPVSPGIPAQMSDLSG